VAVLIGQDAMAGVAGAGPGLLAPAAVLVASLSYAIAGTIGRGQRAMDPMVLATGQLTASTLLGIPLIAVFDRSWRTAAPSSEAIGAVAGLALISTVLAYRLFFRLLRSVGATNTLLVTLLIPVSTAVLSAVVLRELITAREVVGMAIVASGLAIVDGRLIRRVWPVRLSRR
jgi:drug/metabolite transporter (DMT)-like permease